ncbi:uncharacterized protein LOC110766801 isoform X2 [Prunus avium]|uniref:Uncharacterized protein LOC110766801 isoform X2 n=1 Tax=Prunus avium TaxID=42229 RepID=A0A6P5TF77_PRUAV|nr:uncharacterized protein LOC110766801 isoform X2 [Prunus avium]
MDHVSSLECLKLDSQSEVLDKDGREKDLFSPAMVPLNCDTPIIGSEVVGSEADESETDELEPAKLIGHECEYCLKVGDHFTQLCPYKHNVPKNAIVSTRCVVLCNHCGCHFRNSCCANCGRSDGCAVLMDCLNCGKKGEHMTYMCPSRKENPVHSHTIMDGGVVSPPLQIHRPKPIRSKSDESETEQLIGTQQAPSMVCSTGATTSPPANHQLRCEIQLYMKYCGTVYEIQLYTYGRTMYHIIS